MATRVSPRSNASSASSSSAATSSRRPRRNPSFGKSRDSFSSDPWLSDSRSAYSAKQQQQQQLRGGQSFQKSRQWQDCGPRVAELSENTRSWRSQKLAVDMFSSFLDTAQSSGVLQSENVYEEPHFPAQGHSRAHGLKSQWSHAIPKQQSFNAQQCRPCFEEATRDRQESGIARQNEDLANRVPQGKLKLPILPVNRNEGYMPGDSTHGNHDFQTSVLNECPELDCISGSSQHGCRSYFPHSNHGYIDYSQENSVLQNSREAEIQGDQSKHRDHDYAFAPHRRGVGAQSDHYQRPLTIRDGVGSRIQECRGYPPTSNHGSLVYSGNSGQGSRCSTESSLFVRQGKNEFQRDTASYTDHQTPKAPSTRGRELDYFQALSIGGGEVQSKPGLSLNRHSEGVGPTLTSWADECCDNVEQTYEAMPKSVYNTTKTDRLDSDVAAMRRLTHRNDSQRNLETRVVNRDRWQQNSRQVATGTRINLQKSSTGNKQAKQGEAGRKTVHIEKKNSIKHSAPTAMDKVADKAGPICKARASSSNEASLCGAEEGQEALKVVNQANTSQTETEVIEDVLPFIVGTCEDMCPLKEREQRERLRDLAVFERVNRNPSKTSRELAVKKFCRTLTGVKLLPQNVRPLRVLWNTQKYLLNLLDDTDFSFDIVYNFLFDRTRAIRQELGMQRIANSQAINMYEEIVRFHILSEHELNQRGSERRVSDSHLNLQQLSKSLLSLFDLYRLNCNGKLANEAEFRAYYVLLNLDSSKNYQADSLAVWFRQFSAASLKSLELKFARAVLRCYCAGNYRTFFQLAEDATFLQSCLMELHFNEVRLKGLMVMNQGGYKLHPIPLADIAKQFLMKEGDLEELCNLCGLSAGMDSSKVRCLFVKQSQFSVPKELPSYRCPCIIKKRPSSYFEEVTGTRQRL